MLKYPMPKDRRIRLARLHFHMSITPGMPPQIVATCADGFKALTRSKHKITIDDMRLPWKPIYDILKQDLFLTRRQFEYTSVLSIHLSPLLLTHCIVGNYRGVWAILRKTHVNFSTLQQLMRCSPHFFLNWTVLDWMSVFHAY